MTPYYRTSPTSKTQEVNNTNTTTTSGCSTSTERSLQMLILYTIQDNSPPPPLKAQLIHLHSKIQWIPGRSQESKKESSYEVRETARWGLKINTMPIKVGKWQDKYMDLRLQLRHSVNLWLWHNLLKIGKCLDFESLLNKLS